MLEAKEQAKYYIDKIRSIGKATNQTLLIVFIPLTFLWITGIENKYIIVDAYIKNKEKTEKIKSQVAKSQDSIAIINKSITAYLRDTAAGYRPGLKTTNSRVFNNIKGKKEVRYRFEENIRQGGKKSLVFNDTIRNSLGKLQIPVTLPILNVKIENLYFRYIVLVLMIFYSSMLLYAYLKKRNIVNTLHKFVHIIKEKFSLDNQAFYTDYDFNLPFWFFPIKRKKMNREQITLIKIIGINRRQVYYSNLFIYFLCAVLLLINLRLVMINWDLNFKIFHSKYSFTNSFCFLLLLADLIFIVLLLEPVHTKSKKIQQQTGKTGSNRRRFIRLSAVLAASCFFIEPIYGRLFNGNKWYHIPRYLNKLDNLNKLIISDGVIKKGLYVNKSKTKGGGIYYFNKDKKSPCLKTVGHDNWERFLKNLGRINSTYLINNKDYLRRIEEKVLLQFINEKNLKRNEEIPLLKRYIEISSNPLSIEFIDLFTKRFAAENLHLPKYRKVSKKVQEQIGQIRQRHALAMNDYLTNSDKHNPDSYFITNAKQQIKRFEKWDNRMSFAHS